MLAIQTTTNDSLFPLQLSAQDYSDELGFGGETFCPFCNQPFGSCSCGDNVYGSYYIPYYYYDPYLYYDPFFYYYDPNDQGGGGSSTPIPPTEDEVFDPYNVLYHNGERADLSTDWMDDEFSLYLYKVIYGIIIDYYLGTWALIVSTYLDIYFDEFGDLINPDLMIQTRITNNVILTYDWSGKVTVAHVNSKICAIEEYSDSGVGFRQIGKAKVSQQIINVDTNMLIKKLWDEYTGWEGSIEDVRCGKPSVGQNLFVSCPL